MNKKNLLKKVASMTLIAAVIFGLGNAAVSAVSKATSDSHVGVKVVTSTIVDPPIDPPVEPPVGDPDFKIWATPTEFIFEDVSFSSIADTTVSIDPTKATVAGSNPTSKLVSVADQRANVTGPAGWTLQAKMSAPKNTASTSTLTGAQLSWDQTIGEHTDPGNAAAAVAFGTTATAKSADIVNAPLGKVTLTTTNQNIMKAPATKGLGYFGATISNIKLKVLAGTGAAGQSYTTTIDWTLDDTPLP